MHRRNEYRPLHFVAIFDRQGGKCCYCQRPIFLIGNTYHPLFATQEHRVPRVDGGQRHPDNIAASCMQCNHIKDDTPEEQFCAQLHDCGGDINLLTEKQRGLAVANSWRRTGAQPIPHQPPRDAPPEVLPKSDPVNPSPNKPKHGFIKKLPIIVSGDEDGPFTLRMYDLRLHKAYEEMWKYRGSCRGRTLALADYAYERYVCSIINRDGERSYFYRKVTGEWVWS